MFFGDTRNGWFEGSGRFEFPDGVVYEGCFHKGEFHGEGSLTYPGKGTFNGTWVRGIAAEGQFTFADGLIFKEKDWEYLDQSSHAIHSQPSSLPELQPETFDTGEGYYDPRTNLIFSYDGSRILESPSEEDRLWILSHCRQGLKHT